MIDYVTPLLLTVCGLGLAIIGTFFYKIGCSDEKLHAEIERLHAEQVYWELSNCSSCPNVADIQEVLEQNTKLMELCKGLSWCSQERYLEHHESECPLYDERIDGKCRAF